MKDTEFGQEVELPPYAGRVHPDFETSQFLKAISDCRKILKDPSTRILLDTRNRIGLAEIPVQEGRHVQAVLKEFRSAGFRKWKSLFTRSKAYKAWRGAAACISRGIPTPKPCAYLERREKGTLRESFFLAEWIDGAREIRFLLRELPPEDLSRLLAELAEHLGYCHNQGILHKDLSDGNILVKKSGLGRSCFFLVDTNRIRLRNSLPRLKRVRNLIRLGVPPPFQHFFLDQYLGGWRFPKTLKLWYKGNKALYSGYISLKKKLGLKKLARRLKID